MYKGKVELTQSEKDKLLVYNHFFKTKMVQILQDLDDELDNQKDDLVTAESEDEKLIAKGWVEALEFAIKLIDNEG